MDFTNNTATTDIPTQPISSTMIEYTPYSNTESKHRFQYTQQGNKNDYYYLYPDEESNFKNHTIEIEESRRNTPSVSSMTSHLSDYDDITIVNNDKSPISNNKQIAHDEDSFFDYLHSTRISNENLNILSSSLMPDSLTPLATNKHSTLLHSPITSPKKNSNSSLLSVTTNFLEVSSNIENLIFGLSAIYEVDKNTKICTMDYQATFVDDVTVHFADTLSIIKDENDDWLFVEIHSDKRRGFIPKNIVSELGEFIDQLKQYHNQVAGNFFNNSQNIL